jgi:hypothetical protein
VEWFAADGLEDHHLQSPREETAVVGSHTWLL